jgi:hypothetical protein
MAQPHIPYDDLPPTNSVVGNAESFVREAARRMVDTRDHLVDAVVGPSGRPFGHAPMTPDEAYMRYKMMREVDSPDLWAAELRKGKSGPITRQWARFEERYQSEQSVMSPDDVAQLTGQAQSYGV